MRMATSSRWRADARGVAVRACLLLLAAVLAACGATSPSTPPTPAGPPIGCIGVELAVCQEMATGAIAWLPAEGPRPLYVQVGTIECDTGDCEDRGSVTIELRGAAPRAVTVDTVGGRVTMVTPVEIVRSQMNPKSPRISVQVTPFTLGHCGIWSGIDVDGSFWNPVGLVNPNHPDAINSAPGTFTLTSPNSAILRTEKGFVLQLVRHEGSKFLALCD
jgi:hypothetical protein